jgi:DNA repair protein RadC
MKKLLEHKGIGEARAVAITAALELGRRFMKEEAATPESINGPEQVFRMMLPTMKGLLREECWALYLNRSNVVTRRERLTTGTAESTLIDSREVLRSALDQQAKAVILVHNHPSGSPLPGEMDLRETRRLHRALQTFDIDLTDHVIIAYGSFYSFSRETLVNCD